MGTMKMSALNLKSMLRTGGAYLENVYGGAAIVMALMTPIIIGGLAFGAEVGYWELTKRRTQNAADVAAFAAGTQVRSGKSGSDLDTAALDVAEESGFESGANGLELQYPPTSAPLVNDSLNPGTMVDPNGDSEYVYVVLTETVQRNFTRYFARGSNSIDIVSEAVARIQNGRPACVLSLAPNSSDAINVAGNTDVTLTGCDLAANSLSSEAVTQDGNADLTADCISTVGGTDFNNPNNVTLNDCGAPIENAPYTPDPYRNVAQPNTSLPCASFTGGPNSEFSQFATGNNRIGNALPSSDSPTGNNLNKKYCPSGNGTQQIQGITNLAPGTYILDGGDWSVTSSATIIGDGVTLFLTNNATLHISANATVDLSAPTSGQYSGLVIFYDRNNTGDSVINGGANFSLVGAVYGVKQDITFSGNTTGSGPGECTQIIGYTVHFTGNSDFNTTCSASGTTAILAGQSIKIVG